MAENPISTLLNSKKKGLQKDKEPGYIGLELTKEEAAKLVAKADTMQDNPEYVYGTIIYPYRNKHAIQKYSELITQAFHNYNLLQANPETHSTSLKQKLALQNAAD